MESWSPSIGDVLVLKREPDNPKQSSAVAVVKDGDVVGHVPYNLAPTVVTRFMSYYDR